jgi:hypothetical protein
MPCMCGSEIRNLSWLRLAIWMILQCEECNFCAVFATCCSSWVHINTGTSKRSVLLPEGATHLDYIYNSNKMVARSLGSSRSITIYVLYFAYTCLQRVHARSNICQVEHGWFSTYDFFLFLPIPCMHMICIVPWFLYVDLRCILLFMLIVARGGRTFFLEQPGSSLMKFYHRFEFFAARVRASWPRCSKLGSVGAWAI